MTATMVESAFPSSRLLTKMYDGIFGRAAASDFIAAEDLKKGNRISL